MVPLGSINEEVISSFNYGAILIFLILSGLFILIMLIFGWIFRPYRPYQNKLVTYECGEDAVGLPYFQFHPRFFIIALIFIVFDVEVAILFPWVTVFKEFGFLAFVEMLIFIFILLVAFVYVWAKGDLKWLMKR
jgi:NADH-quinone oxidoreductase subunit A